MMREIGVERHAVATAELVLFAVDHQRRRSFEDDGGLATTGLVDRRVLGGPGHRAGVELVDRDVDPLAR
ncbi:MAG: hypothetical protein QOG26_1234 [Solirubrobacterales bacterium]|nr:hypothetical protein [Solirubrobacterales bacterium]